ncbi:hypothetical protein [Planococcus alpniumensis]|nr:hypothetical protein [Planococcus sp. MSAK28401]
MMINAKELAKMGNVSKRRLQTYEDFIKSYKQYKAEKEKLPIEVK